MLRRPFAALFAIASASVLALASLPRAFAEDEPKTEKPKTDDASIFKDWTLCKQRGAAHCRVRGEFWSGKAVGKDQIWLGRIWARGEDYAKAASAYEAFLEYKEVGDDKAKDLNTKNRELARQALIEVYFNGREFEKSVSAAEKFREEFPSSPVIADTWDDQGHAHRLLGDDAKAIECFEKAAEKQFRALSDLVDVHLCAGDVEKAKAAIAKFGPGLDKQPDKVNWLKDTLELVGSTAPGLDVARAVAGEPAKAYDKVTVFFYWSVQSANVDRKLATIELLRRKFSDKMNAVGVATYKKYNVDTKKIDDALSEDQEVDGVKRLMEQSDQKIPPCALVPQAFLDSLKLKWDGQLTVVDAEGKIRWARINESKPYDAAALEKVVEKLTAAK